MLFLTKEGTHIEILRNKYTTDSEYYTSIMKVFCGDLKDLHNNVPEKDIHGAVEKRIINCLTKSTFLAHKGSAKSSQRRKYN